MNDLSMPCRGCQDGRHEVCNGGLCGCIAEHPGDDAMMRGFKQMKRQLHPERETDVLGGWSTTTP